MEMVRIIANELLIHLHMQDTALVFATNNETSIPALIMILGVQKEW